MRSLIMLAGSAAFALASAAFTATPAAGPLHPEDFRADRWKILTRFDTNHDGRFSRGEMAHTTAAVRAELAARGDSRAAKVGTGRLFDRLDVDRDGYLTHTEVDMALNARFTVLDANRDGVLDAAEAALSERLARAGPDR